MMPRAAMEAFLTLLGKLVQADAVDRDGARRILEALSEDRNGCLTTLVTAYGAEEPRAD